MLIETLLFTLFGLLLGASIWWTWRQRQMAQKQAEMNEQLATLGKTVDGVAHDIAQLAGVLALSLEAAKGEPPEEARRTYSDAEQAARAVRSLIDAVRRRPEQARSGPGSVDGILRMTVALMKRAKAPLAVPCIEGDLAFDGAEIDAIRVIQNLLSNAVREAEKIPGAIIDVVLRDGLLTVTNPVVDPSKLDDGIYEWGLSRSGSSGTGLAASRELAAKLGWTIRHVVEGSSVTFIVERAPAVEPTAPAG
ncbi:MAG: hypothetical protein HYY06_33265 [Deltaproteobacteria bacterium]|nr:hypothetical protein [Deltaproteobacteria bacterium]